MNTPTMGERLDAISARMDAGYAERRLHMSNPRKYAEADEQIEAAYRDLRALTAEMNGEHVISNHEECWCEPVHVKVEGKSESPSLDSDYLAALARQPRGFA